MEGSGFTLGFHGCDQTVGEQILAGRTHIRWSENEYDFLRDERGLSTFDTVRGYFPEGGPLFEGARIMARTHVQICVRTPERSIRGYFRPIPNVGLEVP